MNPFPPDLWRQAIIFINAGAQLLEAADAQLAVPGEVDVNSPGWQEEDQDQAGSGQGAEEEEEEAEDLHPIHRRSPPPLSSKIHNQDLGSHSGRVDWMSSCTISCPPPLYPS